MYNFTDHDSDIKDYHLKITNYIKLLMQCPGPSKWRAARL